MLRAFALTAFVALVSRSASAQRARQDQSAVGTWRGTSLCLVRPSPCNNEVVVYRVIRVGTTDSVSLDARKIVNGEEQEMGVLGCRITTPSEDITCTIRNGVWHFTVRGDSLTGELRLPDNTKFRDVRTVRSR